MLYTKNCTWKVMPDTVMIELTTICNFLCIMCPNENMKREKSFMQEKIFKQSLDRCKEAGIKKIKLYTTGESLLHPKFMEFWKLAVSYPFDEVMISTNGSLLTEEIIRELVKSNKLKIQFSFSGWDKQSYQMRYVNGNFDDAVKKIKLLKKMIEEAKLPLSTLTINGIISNTQHSIAKCKTFLKNAVGLDEKQLNIHHVHDWNNAVSHSDKSKCKKEIGKRYYCHIANTRIGIFVDGKATACGCLDVNGELVIGDIQDNSIEEIRTGEKFNEFKRKLTCGEIDELMCLRCESLKVLK